LIVPRKGILAHGMKVERAPIIAQIKMANR